MFFFPAGRKQECYSSNFIKFVSKKSPNKTRFHSLDATVLEILGSAYTQVLCMFVLQNIIWTEDRLIRRGWLNNRFTTRIWNAILPWLGRQDIDTSLWENDVCVKDWLMNMASREGNMRKARAPMLILVPWKFWKERNTIWSSVATLFGNDNYHKYQGGGEIVEHC
jgi:hypothetical protein